MDSNWYLLYAKALDDKGQLEELPPAPLVGQDVVHRMGESSAEEKMKADKESPLWEMLQEEYRPIWAPDLLSLGFAVAFRRSSLPKLAVQMGLRNPEKHKQKDGGLRRKEGNRRVFYFDDVWVVGVTPKYRPIPYPKAEDVKPEDWWYRVNKYRNRPFVGPWLVPGGVKVVTGIQRMADVVQTLLDSPSYPKPQAWEENEYVEFVWPPALSNKTHTDSKKSLSGPGPMENDGKAGMERFK